MKFKLRLLVICTFIVEYKCRPEIWPPTGELKPNNYQSPPACRFVPSVVNTEVVEEKCITSSEEVCKSVTEETFEESVETSCEPATYKTFCENRTSTNEIEVCEVSECDETQYEIHMKDECAYEVKLKQKCWRSYEVIYENKCSTEQVSKCEISNSITCRSVEELKCKKVPRIGSQRCKMVPRQKRSGPCFKSPVRRPKCLPKRICKKVPQTQKEEVCEKIKQEPKCTDNVIKTPVTKTKEVCETVPKEVCSSERVIKPTVVNERLCDDAPTSSENSLIVATLG